MGRMTIDEAIEVYKHPTQHFSSEHREADKIAIQSMKELKLLRAELKSHILYDKELAEQLKKDGAEYNNGWITCEAEMPKEHDSIFAKLKGTDKWNDEMFEKISDTVNVTVVDEYGNRITTHAHTVDGKWSCDLLKLNKTYKITAWQSLPEPYKPKGE